ncbi:serine protease [Evansella sp. AB-rgal1]|uniref:serine protease n=1 Tax=Evansella sp. AB-rgal1 TaxID=3242696 RepID=UPI00359DEC40
MKAQMLEVEIKEVKEYLASLEKQLQELQENCDHHFQENTYYETCLKCNKVNSLYY